MVDDKKNNKERKNVDTKKDNLDYKKFSTDLGNSDLSLIQRKAYEEKIRVAITSIIASSCLAIAKFSIAMFTNSLGLLSEGMHSGLDVFAALMTLYAVKISRKPPDPEHNYGYAKFESLASLGAVLLLFVIAGWIFYEGLERILHKNVIPEVTIFSFLVLVASIIVDFSRSRVLYRIANKYGSQAIEADALHFRADMITSSVVLVGLIIVFAFNIPNADSYAAIIVACLIVYTSLGLGRRTLDVLLDKAPKGIQARILESIKGFEGIKTVHSIRVRKVGKDTFVDLHIEVPRIFTHDKAHRIATNVENKIKNDILPNSDVVVHVDAVEDSVTETIKDKVKLISEDFTQIKNIHSIYLSNIISNNNFRMDPNNKKDVFYNPDSYTQLHLYLDVQVDNTLDFRTAHEVVDNFEKRIKEEIHDIKRITTHIETELDIESTVGREERADLEYIEKIKNMALSIEGVYDCSDISIVYINNELHITLVIKIGPSFIKDQNNNDFNISHDEDIDFSIESAHHISTLVQDLIIEKTNASRVVVHAEPP